MVFCHNCGVKLQRETNFCPRCGVSQKLEANTPYPYPHPYPYQYQSPRLSFVSKVLFIIAGMFLLVHGLLLLGLIILGQSFFIFYFDVISIIIFFIGFTFAEITAFFISKNRNYNAALGASFTVLGCCIINIFLFAINLWAIIMTILGIAFLYISRNEFFQYEYIAQHTYNTKRRR